jgi:hypothetical protein
VILVYIFRVAIVLMACCGIAGVMTSHVAAVLVSSIFALVFYVGQAELGRLNR